MVIQINRPTIKGLVSTALPKSGLDFKAQASIVVFDYDTELLNRYIRHRAALVCETIKVMAIRDVYSAS